MSTAHITDHKIIAWDEEEDGIYIEVVHPPTCLTITHCYPINITTSEPIHGTAWSKVTGQKATGEYAYETTHPRCIVAYEEESFGLCAANVDYKLRDQHVWDSYGETMTNFLFAHIGQKIPITVDVHYGWSASTWVAPAEWDWEFSWAPTALIDDADNSVSNEAHHSPG
jgi:hypothetical protein